MLPLKNLKQMKITAIIILVVSAFVLLVAWKNYCNPQQVIKRKMKYWDKSRKQIANKYKNSL